MPLDHSPTGTDARAERTDAKQATETPPPPPDNPGAQGAPSRADSRASASADTGQQEPDSRGDKLDARTSGTTAPADADSAADDRTTDSAASKSGNLGKGDALGSEQTTSSQAEQSGSIERKGAEGLNGADARSGPDDIEDGHEPQDDRASDSADHTPEPSGFHSVDESGHGEGRRETVGAAETAGADHERESDQKQAETVRSESPLEQMPSDSHANLAEEFDARRASREFADEEDRANEQISETDKRDTHSPKLDEKAIREQIDPFAPDLDRAEGNKEPFERTVRDSDADWTDGVDRFEDLPTGEALAEEDEDADKVDRFRRGTSENYGVLDGRAKAIGKSLDQAFGPRPPGHAETRADGPTMASPHHSGIDAGSTASALLALGIVGAEGTRRVLSRIREWRDNEGHR